MTDQQIVKSEEKLTGASSYIILKVVGQDATEINFRVKRNCLLKKLKQAYSDRVNLSVTQLRFLFDGRRINDNETPEQLEMIDDDMIEVFFEQVGGISLFCM